MNIKTVLFILIVIKTDLITGKVKPRGNWNRYFRGTYIAPEDYVETLSWKVGNITEENGLNFKTTNSEFQISETAVGVDLNGIIRFSNGIVTTNGKVIPTPMAAFVNRTADLTSAILYFAVGVDQINCSYELKTELANNNAIGEVEIGMKNIDFFFEMTHTFATNSNVIKPLDVGFGSEVIWKIIPRDVKTYAMEVAIKRNVTNSDWYKKGLLDWQRDILGPLLLDQAKDLPFPISSN